MVATKFCTSCGSPATGARFCTSCGAPMPVGTPTEPVDERGDAALSDRVEPQIERSSERARSASPSAEAEAGRTPRRGEPATGQSGKSDGAGNKPRTAESGATSARYDPRRPQPTGDASSPAGGQTRRWLPIALSAGTVLLTFLVVATILLVVSQGGSSNKKKVSGGAVAAVAARGDFTRSAGLPYFVMLPSGWSAAKPPVVPNLATQRTVQSPTQAGVRLTVGEVPRAPADPAAVGKGLVGPRRGKGGYVRLRDGRRAWKGTYAAARDAVTLLVIRSCHRMFVVAANHQQAGSASVQDQIDTVASALQGGC